MSGSWPVIVLGGTGYVGGEMLRLVAAHPELELGAAVSTSRAGGLLAESFAHLGPCYPEARFVSFDAAIEGLADAPHWIVLSAAPHGASAAMVARLLDAAEAAGVALTVVDASADFRFNDADAFASVYRQPHAAPARLPEFHCAVPEHSGSIDTPHAAHPGCFATTMLLAIVPLVKAGACSGPFYVSAVTGSTGAGRTPRDTTHHPVRQSNLFAYLPLAHRHAPEVRALAQAATGRDIDLKFVPHSGPFARGIHATIFCARAGAGAGDGLAGQVDVGAHGAAERILGGAGKDIAVPSETGTRRAASEFNTARNNNAAAAELRALFNDYYADSQFVRVGSTPPRVKDIAGSNYAQLSVAVDGDTIVVCSVLDNLVKGAAGGSIQWVNRLLGLPESLGLTAPAAGWV